MDLDQGVGTFKAERKAPGDFVATMDTGDTPTGGYVKNIIRRVYES